MISLIVTIIAITLVVMLSVAVLYYGGPRYAESTVRAAATTLITQGNQIQAAGALSSAQGDGWPAAAPHFSPPYLKAMPIPPLAAYAAGSPSGNDWTYYAQDGTPGHFVLKNKIREDVCMEVNRLQGLTGIPAAWTGTHMVQCFGPGVATGAGNAKAYTFFFDPSVSSPAQVVRIVDQSVEEAEDGGSDNPRPGYPRLCPDGSVIDSGLCPTRGGGGGGGPGDGNSPPGDDSGSPGENDPKPGPTDPEPTANKLEVTPTVSFPWTPVGQDWSTLVNGKRVVKLTNKGLTPVTLTSVLITAGGSDFTMDNRCGAEVLPNSDCFIEIFFKPTNGGPRTGTVTIVSSGSVDAQTSALNGEGGIGAQLFPEGPYVVELGGWNTFDIPALGDPTKITGVTWTVYDNAYNRVTSHSQGVNRARHTVVTNAQGQLTGIRLQVWGANLGLDQLAYAVLDTDTAFNPVAAVPLRLVNGRLQSMQSTKLSFGNLLDAVLPIRGHTDFPGPREMYWTVETEVGEFERSNQTGGSRWTSDISNPPPAPAPDPAPVLNASGTSISFNIPLVANAPAGPALAVAMDMSDMLIYCFEYNAPVKPPLLAISPGGYPVDRGYHNQLTIPASGWLTKAGTVTAKLFSSAGIDLSPEHPPAVRRHGMCDMTALTVTVWPDDRVSPQAAFVQLYVDGDPGVFPPIPVTINGDD